MTCAGLRGLTDMLPSFVVDDVGYGLKTYPVGSGQRGKGLTSCLVAGAYLADLCGRELGRAVPFTPMGLRVGLGAIALSPSHRFGMGAGAISVALAGAPLSRGIAHVVERRAREQMLGVDAAAHVTVVAHEQPWRDGGMAKRVGKAVCQFGFALAKVIRAVSCRMKISCPYPAGVWAIRLIDKGPEAFLSLGVHGVLRGWYVAQRTTGRVQSQWWLEEEQRQREAGDAVRADAIHRSLAAWMLSRELRLKAG